MWKSGHNLSFYIFNPLRKQVHEKWTWDSPSGTDTVIISIINLILIINYTWYLPEIMLWILKGIHPPILKAPSRPASHDTRGALGPTVAAALTGAVVSPHQIRWQNRGKPPPPWHFPYDFLPKLYGPIIIQWYRTIRTRPYEWFHLCLANSFAFSASFCSSCCRKLHSACLRSELMQPCG